MLSFSPRTRRVLENMHIFILKKRFRKSQSQTHSKILSKKNVVDIKILSKMSTYNECFY